MKNPLRLLCSCFLLCILCLQAKAQGTAFTYQGKLNDAGGPANGLYDLQLGIFDASVNGDQIGNFITNSAVGVTNGLFTTTLDFGGIFTGTNYWLDISVRTNGAGAFTSLAPRQQITPTPYAIFANTASNVSGTISASQLSGSYSGAVSFTNSQNNFGGAFNGDGSGLTNVPGAVAWTDAATSQQASSDIGYLATNDSQQTVITLPVSPNVGDVVRVSGIGAGGWKLLPNSGQTILAGNFIFSQSVGTLWTPTYSGSGSFNKVTISSDGRDIAALNGSRTIFSGDSGITWTANTAAGGNNDMAASSDGTKLVSAGSSIYTSPDGGKTWNTSTNLSCVSVASSADGNTLYAIRNGSPFPIYYSINGGTTWLTNNMGSRSWTKVVCSADGTHVAAVASSIYYSTDRGNTWTNSNVSAGFGLAMYPDGSRLIAFTGGGIYIFQNGVSSYTLHSIGININAMAMSSDGSRIVAAGANGIYVSKDFGSTWTATSAPAVNWTGVASSSDGGRWAATTGSQIYIAQPATTASTGYLVGAQGATVELQYLGNNYFLPLSSQGAISAY